MSQYKIVLLRCTNGKWKWYIKKWRGSGNEYFTYLDGEEDSYHQASDKAYDNYFRIGGEI